MKNFLIPLAFRRELCKSVLQFRQSVGTLICGIGKQIHVSYICVGRKTFGTVAGFRDVAPLSGDGFFI